MEKNNEQHMNQMSTTPFELGVLILDIARHWLLIVLAILVISIVSYIISDVTYSPRYTTKMTFVVSERNCSSTVFSQLSTTSELATVFSELLNSSILRHEILTDIEQSSFNGTISASAISETNLVTVSVTASNPRTAFLAAQSIAEHHGEVTYLIMDNVVLELLQYPTVPVMPSNRKQDLFTFFTKSIPFAATAITMLLAMLFYVRDSVRSGAEARKKLDCHYLGALPHERKYKTLQSQIRHRKTNILVSNPAASFQYVESMNKLRQRIEQRMHNRKVLMVASFQENEGKSTVAVNLALSLAQKRHRVLLIDCDLRKPACQLLLGITTPKNTLMDVLTGMVAPSDAVIHCYGGTLSLIVNKRSHKNTGDLLASKTMQFLINWAREKYDYVILDLPPVSAGSDAELITEYADAALLVVKQNSASSKSINKAIATLSGGKTKLLGCVLNDMHSAFSPLTHGYPYGQYGRYGKHNSYYT